MGVLNALKSVPFTFCFTAFVIPFVTVSFVADCFFGAAQRTCSFLHANRCASYMQTASIKTKRIMRSIGGEFYAATSEMFFPFYYVLYANKNLGISNGAQYLELIRERMKQNKHNIIMANHILYTDWLYVWIFLLRGCDDPSSACFVMKDSLKRVPVLGRTMDFLGFLFLARDAEKDVAYLERKIDLNQEKRSNIVIFPEGTTFCTDTHENTVNFCISKGYTVPKYCLLPKPTGFATILQRENVNGVLDLTFCYEDTNYFKKQPTKPVYKYYTITSLLFGRYPKEVAVRLRYYDKQEVDQTNVKKWLNDRFYEKDYFIGDLVSNEGNPVQYEPIHYLPSQSKYRLLFEAYFLLAGIGAVVGGIALAKGMYKIFFK